MINTAKIFIYIEFSADNLPKERINDLWNNCDVYFSMKGEPFFEFESGQKIKKYRKYDYCNIRYEFLQRESTLNDILINFLITQRDSINYISSNYVDVTPKIHICIYPSSEQYTFDFSIDLLKLLSLLNIEIGITVLQLG